MAVETTLAPSPSTSRIVLPPPPPPAASSPPGVHIGVLALQGAFHEHLHHLRRLAASPSLGTPIVASTVRTAQDLEGLHGLIIPGGESTAISLLASSQAATTPSHPQATFLDHLRAFVRSCNDETGGGRSVWGTCAGMILLADEVVEGSMKKGGQEVIGGLGIKVVRNQWGRQTESFEHPLHVSSLLEPSIPFPGIFIRAPVIHTLLSTPSASSSKPSPRPPLEILASVPPSLLPIPPPSAPSLGPDAHVVAVKQGRIMATSNHPELSEDTRFHEMWIRECILSESSTVPKAP